MNNHIYRLRTIPQEEIVSAFDMREILRNSRTVILQNDKMRISVDETVARVLIFNENDKKTENELDSFFYGSVVKKEIHGDKK